MAIGRGPMRLICSARLVTVESSEVVAVLGGFYYILEVQSGAVELVALELASRRGR